jgi:hypothetical protein
MSEWTKNRLDQMIVDGIEESLSLDYKRADSLIKTDGKKSEITKDVSSFANSSGGVLIYGVAEFDDNLKRYLPEKLDPIKRSEISKEWLDQVIQTIQPRIENVVIHPVTISEQDNTVCYVVEVPQSHTAHMARDHRYYKRHNFNALAMEDYEVRDVMSRRTNPKIRAFIFVNKRAGGFKPEGVILVKVENVGRVLARHVMVELEMPLDMDGTVAIEKPVIHERGEDGDFHLLRLVPDLRNIPIFPGSDIILRRKIHTDARIQRVDRQPINSTRHIKISIFADEMIPLRATLDIAPALLGWTPVLASQSDSQLVN